MTERTKYRRETFAVPKPSSEPTRGDTLGNAFKLKDLQQEILDPTKFRNDVQHEYKLAYAGVVADTLVSRPTDQRADAIVYITAGSEAKLRLSLTRLLFEAKKRSA